MSDVERALKEYEGRAAYPFVVGGGDVPYAAVNPDIARLVAALRAALETIHGIGHAEGDGPVGSWDCPSHATECRESEARILALLSPPSTPDGGAR